MQLAVNYIKMNGSNENVAQIMNIIVVHNKNVRIMLYFC